MWWNRAVGVGALALQDTLNHSVRQSLIKLLGLVPFCDIEDSVVTVFVFSVGHRRQVYKR